jgi:putative transposase
MPRTSRAVEAGGFYHVLNRGNGRMALFHKEDDYRAFQKILREGLERYPVDLLAYTHMPNHWHKAAARRMGLEFTLNRPGRPSKASSQKNNQ